MITGVERRLTNSDESRQPESQDIRHNYFDSEPEHRDYYGDVY